MAITAAASRRLLFLVCALVALLASVAQATPPSAPPWLYARPGDSVVSLEWGPSVPGSNGLGGYNLYRSETLIYTGLRQSYIDRDLQNDATYSYTVEAFDESQPPEVSPRSQEATARPFGSLGSVECDLDESVVYGRADFPYGHDYGGGANDFMGGLFVGGVDDPAALGRAYLGFPLAGLPPECTLEAAWLTAHLNRIDQECCPTQIPIAAHGLYDPAASWQEATLSWNNSPPLADDPQSVLDAPFAAPSWLRWDVTAEVDAGYAGERTRVSLALRAVDDLSANPAASWKYLAEREFGIDGRPETYHPPRLELVWSAAHDFWANWHLMSLPLVPSDPDPPAVFDPHPISGNLTRWDAEQQRYVTYYSWNPGEFGPCQTGVGYWYSAVDPGPVDYVGTPHDTTQEILCTVTGWHMIGHPFPLAVALDDCQIHNGETQETKSLYDAWMAAWVQMPMYYYDPSLGGYCTCGFDPWHDDDHLRPWLGYQFAVHRSNLTLIIPVPEGMF